MGRGHYGRGVLSTKSAKNVVLTEDSGGEMMKTVSNKKDWGFGNFCDNTTTNLCEDFSYK